MAQQVKRLQVCGGGGRWGDIRMGQSRDRTQQEESLLCFVLTVGLI